MLEKMRKTLSVAILVTVKVLVDNVCAYEMQDLGKAQILETRVNFLETRSKLLQKQVW